MDVNPSPKPQNETTPDSDSLSKTSSSPSPTSTSSLFIKTNTQTSDSKSVTLSSTPNNSQQGYPSFSKLLEGVMAADSAVSPNPAVKDVSFQGQFGMSHQEALASFTAKATQAQMQQPEPKSMKSPIKQIDSSGSSPSAIIHEKKPPQKHKDSVQEGKDKKPSLHGSKPADSPPSQPAGVQLANEKVEKRDLKQENSFQTDEQADYIPRTPNSDGYGWRKYGQKQVKNSGSSRSYYRCTYFNCVAKKKVQHLDVSGKVIEVVYKGDHNHDPPQNLKGSSRKRDATSVVQVIEPVVSSVQKAGDQHAPTPKCKKEVEQPVVTLTHDCGERNLRSCANLPEKDFGEENIMTSDPTQRLTGQETTLSTDGELCKSSKSDESSMKEFDVIPLKKRRIKESSKICSESVYRTFKEPKVVVHASGDVGISNDGYRWRKYGQKMVKGNPNPRSYYRCSSTGCPVRKHVERATDNSASIIVTYEGIHDHDKPIPKKCNGSPKSPVHVAATNTPVEKSETKSPPLSQGPSALRSGDGDSDLKGEKPGEAGTDKVLESARTLLSIGIELKSC